MPTHDTADLQSGAQLEIDDDQHQHQDRGDPADGADRDTEVPATVAGDERAHADAPGGAVEGDGDGPALDRAARRTAHAAVHDLLAPRLDHLLIDFGAWSAVFAEAADDTRRAALEAVDADAGAR